MIEGPRPPAERAARAAELLDELGFAGCRVEVKGHLDEIAVLTAPDELWDRLLQPGGSEIVNRLKLLGFRFVALDLDQAG